jgi:hypothetical protein
MTFSRLERCASQSISSPSRPRTSRTRVASPRAGRTFSAQNVEPYSVVDPIRTTAATRLRRKVMSLHSLLLPQSESSSGSNVYVPRFESITSTTSVFGKGWTQPGGRLASYSALSDRGRGRRSLTTLPSKLCALIAPAKRGYPIPNGSHPGVGDSTLAAEKGPSDEHYG